MKKQHRSDETFEILFSEMKIAQNRFHKIHSNLTNLFHLMQLAPEQQRPTPPTLQEALCKSAVRPRFLFICAKTTCTSIFQVQADPRSAASH